MANTNAVEQRVFKVNDLDIAAQQWGPIDGLPVMAIHGWLDNSASFSRLAPELDRCRMVALDLAGNGQSSFRSAQGSYNIWDDLLDILAIADQLGWRRFHLLGHSRGAIVGLLLSATMPERIERFIALDGLLPGADDRASVPQLRQYLRDQRVDVAPQGRVYGTREQAIRKRCEKNGLERDDCFALAERGLEAVDAGFRWRYDPRVRGASAFKLSVEQSDGFLQALTVPTLLLLARRGFGGWSDGIERIKANDSIQMQSFDGGHHLHMQADLYANVAEAINQWL